MGIFIINQNDRSMLDFVMGLHILLIVLVAMTLFAGTWIIGVSFNSWGDL